MTEPPSGGITWRDLLSAGPLAALLGLGTTGGAIRWYLIVITVGGGLAALLVARREARWRDYNDQMERRARGRRCL